MRISYTRRAVLRAGAAMFTIGVPRFAFGQAIPNVTLPNRPEILIKNAAVITVDPALGTLERADIHVRNGEIVAVGADLAAPGAEVIDASRMIAMPGFVDTHWHVWGSVGRSFVTDARGYARVKNTTAPFFTPEDFYHGTSLALAEAIHAGVTGVLNFAHNVRSPQHADGEIKGHGDCGVRSLYCYGSPDEPPSDRAMDLRDVERAKRQWFATPAAFEGVNELGMAIRGPAHSTMPVWTQEAEFCEKHGFKNSYHAGQSRSSQISAVDFRKRGFLSRRTVLAHFLYATDEDRQAMRETGASWSLSVMGEFRSAGDGEGDPRAQLLRMKRDGVVTSFSIDATSISPVNMFDSMRSAWRYGIGWNGTPTQGMAAVTLPDVLRCATLGGAQACGWDKICGSLTPGKRADIILIRRDDINMVPSFEIEAGVVKNAQPTNIDTVLIDGRIMKRKGEIVGVDVERIKVNAVESAKRLYEVAKRVPG